MWENHTLITAHSGADETGDNSREYLRYVEDMQADCFEVDVRLISNGSADLSGQAAVEAGVSNGSFAGSDSLKDDTASQPAEGILALGHDEAGEEAVTLEEAFGILQRNPGMKINCDLKEAGLEGCVYRLAKRMGVEKQLIYSGDVDPDNVLKDTGMCLDQIAWNVEAAIHDVDKSRMFDHAYILETLERMCLRCEQYGIKTINIYEGLLDDEVMDIVNRQGLRLSVWTVNDPARMLYFFKADVENMTTRKLKLAREMASRLHEDSNLARETWRGIQVSDS